VLIGFFLWAAENAATFLRAWQYPSQESVWTMVHAAKLGSWSLLVVVSIVLVAAVKAYEGRLYGNPRDLSVLRAGPTPPATARALEWRPGRVRRPRPPPQDRDVALGPTPATCGFAPRTMECDRRHGDSRHNAT